VRPVIRPCGDRPESVCRPSSGRYSDAERTPTGRDRDIGRTLNGRHPDAIGTSGRTLNGRHPDAISMRCGSGRGGKDNFIAMPLVLPHEARNLDPGYSIVFSNEFKRPDAVLHAKAG
jgi:hypothetical protein